MPLATASSAKPQASRPDVTWYTPVCDNVLRKIANWYFTYRRGDPAASRPWVNMDGRVVDRVTKYANRIRFKPNELDHLIRILDALAKTRELVDFYRKVRGGLKRGKLLPGGEYEVILDAYIQDVEETLEALVRAKTGRLQSIEDIAKEQMSKGKMPFEV
jgi:hypothetical protein